MDDHRIANRHVTDRRTNFLDPAGILMTKRVRQSHPRLLLPLPLDDMQVGAAKASTANANDDIEWTGHLWLGNLFDFRKFFILVQTDCFHLYSSIGSSSGPTKREPGRPHSRKKSPVARHRETLVSLHARIKDLLLCLALATLACVAFEPLRCVISGALRARACVESRSRVPCSNDVSRACRVE